MKPGWKSILFVSIQFLALAIIGLTGKLIADQGILLLVELLGLFIGVWAVLAMRIGHFNIAPEPLTWSKLVSRGPYQFIRHPMYLALLLTTLPLVVSEYDVLRLLVWLILFVNLILKMNYEESLLLERFPDYSNYRNRTSRLVPGIY